MEIIDVRRASPKDCHEIRKLIQELADYEKKPEGPKYEASALVADGFSAEPYFECYVASKENSEGLAGFALYYYAFPWNGKTVYLEDLYVCPEYRSKGVGSKLWKAVVQAGLAAGATNCRLSVLEWNTPSIAYYERKGAVSLTHGEKGLKFHRFHDTSKSLASLNVKPPVEGIFFRKAGLEDMPALQEMFHEFKATLEPSVEFAITEESLSDVLSSSPPLIDVIMAECSSQAIGFALYFRCYSTWGRAIYLQTVFVKPPFRRQKLATALMSEVLKEAVSKGCSRLDFVFDRHSSPGVAAFFDKLGAVNLGDEKGWLVMNLGKQEMERFVNS